MQINTHELPTGVLCVHEGPPSSCDVSTPSIPPGVTRSEAPLLHRIRAFPLSGWPDLNRRPLLVGPGREGPFIRCHKLALSWENVDGGLLAVVVGCHWLAGFSGGKRGVGQDRRPGSTRSRARRSTGRHRTYDLALHRDERASEGARPIQLPMGGPCAGLNLRREWHCKGKGRSPARMAGIGGRRVGRLGVAEGGVVGGSSSTSLQAITIGSVATRRYLHSCPTRRSS